MPSELWISPLGFCDNRLLWVSLQARSQWGGHVAGKWCCGRGLLGHSPAEWLLLLPPGTHPHTPRGTHWGAYEEDGCDKVSDVWPELYFLAWELQLISESIWRFTLKLQLRWASQLKRQHEICEGLEDAAQMSTELKGRCVETKLNEQTKWMS